MQLKDVTGSRGEKILELCLTEYESLPEPLFWPGFLGDKWPAVDFYVELNAVPGKRLYFFAQAKSTSQPLSPRAKSLTISATKEDIRQLLSIPGPTYLFGIHEPSKRVFVHSVHQGMAVRAITRIPVRFELNSRTLKELHDEIQSFWNTNMHKPTASKFS